MWLQNIGFGILNRLLRSGVVTLYPYGQSQGESRTFRFTDFVLYGFRRNWVVAACLRKVGTGCTSVGIDIAEPDSPLVSGKSIPLKELSPDQRVIYGLLQRPNPEQSMDVFLRLLVAQYYLAGATYTVGSGIGTKKFLGRTAFRGGPTLRLRRPDWVTVHDNGIIINNFEYIDDQNRKEILKPSEVLYIHYPDPANQLHALIPLEACAYGIDSSNALLVWNKSLLDKSGVAAGVLRIKGSRDLGDKERKKIENRFEKDYMGADNAGRVVVINGETAEYQPLGHSPRDMNWMGANGVMMRQICAVIGVPSEFVGDKEKSTYNNMDAALEDFYVNTVLPLMKHIVRELQNKLRFWYQDPSITLTLNTSDIPVLQENSMKVAEENALSDWRSIDEQRIRDGLEPFGIPETKTPRALLSINPPGDSATEDQDDDGERSLSSDPEGKEDEIGKRLKAISARGDAAVFHELSRFPTLEERAREVERHQALRLQFEPRYRGKIKEYWKGQKKRIIAAQRSFSDRYWMHQSIRVKEVFDGKLESEIYVDLLQELQAEMMLKFGNDAANEYLRGLDIDFDFDLDRPGFEQFLTKDLTRRSKLINKTTSDKINKIITGAQGDPTIDVGVSEQIENYFDDISEWRSRSIARTEIGRADSLAIDEAYDQIEEKTDEKIRKEWLSARDDNVRDTHKPNSGLDGQVIRHGDEFKSPSGAKGPGPLLMEGADSASENIN